MGVMVANCISVSTVPQSEMPQYVVDIRGFS